MVETDIPRTITSLLVVGSVPPLLLLLIQTGKDIYANRNLSGIQFVLVVIYLTLLISGLMTLYINTYVLFFHIMPSSFTGVSLTRNLIKQIGIFFISWRLLFITRERSGGD